MNTHSVRDRQRTLVYIPIIHTAADMGTLAPSIRGRKLPMLGRQGLLRATAVVEQRWEEIERMMARLPLPPGTVRIYQDGLPVCQHERKIVSDLAASGSRNHRLLLQLEARGATLMGTESPELLVEEYQLAIATVVSGGNAAEVTRQQRLHDALLEKRDRFAADRINQTLGDGESGVLFMGMLHSVAPLLDRDIRVVYPLGLPKVKSRKNG